MGEEEEDWRVVWREWGRERNGREGRLGEWGGDIYSQTDIPGDIADRLQPRRPRTMIFSQIWLQAKYEFDCLSKILLATYYV